MGGLTIGMLMLMEGWAGRVEVICFVAAEHNFYPQKKPQQCPHWDLAKTFDAKMLMRLWDSKIGIALNRMKVSMELKSKLLQNVMVRHVTNVMIVHSVRAW